MLSLLSSLSTFLLFTKHCSAGNVTAVNQLIFALSSDKVSHAYDNVFGSVIAADKNAITVHLDCRPSTTSNPSSSSCSDQDATITAGPSTLVYTSSLGTFYAYRACSKTVDGGEFVCTYHHHVHESNSVDTVSSILHHLAVADHTIDHISSGSWYLCSNADNSGCRETDQRTGASNDGKWNCQGV